MYRYVLKNVWRDWSEEGAQERQQSFGRICKELRARLGEPPQQGAPPPHVLVPGCGLARLCCEIAGLVCRCFVWLCAVILQGWYVVVAHV